MRKVLLTIYVLAVFTVASCRPAVTPMPIAPSPSFSPLSPLSTPLAPQVVPAATHQTPSSPASAPAATSGIHLAATIGPTCPGPERPGQVCTRPYEGLFIVTDKAGAEVARATTDQNGEATIDLLPGTYTIAPTVEGKLPLAAATTVTVLSGQYAEVSLGLDSGIR
jgi:hypothetical protein